MKLAPLSAVAFAIGATAAAQDVYTVDGIQVSILGRSLVALPDLDGDGIAEWASGEPRYALTRGRVRVHSGATGAMRFEIVGDVDEMFGVDVVGVGDLNGDGVPDLAVGSEYDSRTLPTAGRASIHSGVDGALIRELGSPGLEDRHGAAIVAMDDVDGDGVPDVAVTTLREDGATFNVGAVRAYSGATGAELYRVEGDTANDLFGVTLALGDDLDGDGLRDLLVGDTADTPGEVHVLSAATGSTLLRIQANDLSESSRFGSTIENVGDQDGDGIDDLLVGAPSDSTSAHLAGLVRLVSGATGGTLLEWQGLTLEDALGSSLGSVADVDGDGRRDFVVSARRADLGDARTGYVSVFSSVDGARLRMWIGRPGSEYGTDVAVLGDANGDGVDDVLIGALASTSGAPTPHRVHLASGAFSTARTLCHATAALGCPCGTPSDEGGCRNSDGESAKLFAHGSTSLATDDVTFHAVDLDPLGFLMLVMGTGSGQTPVGNGVLCLGGTLTRTTPVFYGITPPTVRIGPGLPEQLQISAGTTTYFQGWYRDTQDPCGGGSNLTSALAIRWAP